MKQTSTTIVFFGSGPVAAASLELLAKDFHIEAVVTKPRPPHHKGDVPVLRVAEKLGLNVQTVANKKELDELVLQKPFASQIGILIDFGIIVSQAVIDYFPLGIINSHFSILPEWRGADPITFSILSGQKTTGVSLMLLVEKMDEGPLIGYGTYQLSHDITTPKLTDDLVTLSYQLLKQHVPSYIKNCTSVAQSTTGRTVSYSRKLTKDDAVLDWVKPAQQLEREIRAFIEWPKSKAMIAGKEVVITKARVADLTLNPGEAKKAGKKLLIGCGKQSLEIERLKPTGKQEMTAEAFLAGYGQSL